MIIAPTKARGFTIVELLIVIVVIAILALISTIVFNGVQQRAQNSAKLAAIDSVVKLVKLYHTTYQQYPITTVATMCLTANNICTTYNGTVVSASNNPLVSAISEFGTVPDTSGDSSSDTVYGIYYYHNSALSLQGDPNPVLIVFWLKGTSQDCRKVGGMISVQDTGVPNTMTRANSSNPNTAGGKTRCYLMFPS